MLHTLISSLSLSDGVARTFHYFSLLMCNCISRGVGYKELTTVPHKMFSRGKQIHQSLRNRPFFEALKAPTTGFFFSSGSFRLTLSVHIASALSTSEKFRVFRSSAAYHVIVSNSRVRGGTQVLPHPLLAPMHGELNYWKSQCS